MIFGREPVAVAAFIAIAINLFVSFGLKLTVDQIALINSLVVAGLALITRQASTPRANPSLPLGTTVMTPDGQPNGQVTAVGSGGDTGGGNR